MTINYLINALVAWIVCGSTTYLIINLEEYFECFKYPKKMKRKLLLWSYITGIIGLIVVFCFILKSMFVYLKKFFKK